MKRGIEVALDGITRQQRGGIEVALDEIIWKCKGVLR